MLDNQLSMLKISLQENIKKTKAKELYLERELEDKKDQLVQQMRDSILKKEEEMQEKLQDELHETTKRTMKENLRITMELQLISHRTMKIDKENKVLIKIQ